LHLIVRLNKIILASSNKIKIKNVKESIYGCSNKYGKQEKP